VSDTRLTADELRTLRNLLSRSTRGEVAAMLGVGLDTLDMIAGGGDCPRVITRVRVALRGAAA
jgi:hypothetical protein